MKHLKLFEQFLFEASEVAKKILTDLDDKAQLHKGYIPAEALAAIESVLKKHKKLAGKDIEQAAKQIRMELEDIGIMANDLGKLDVELIIIDALGKVNESNEMRGYYEYEYDIKSKQLNRIGSGVASELSIGTPYDPRHIKNILKQKDKKIRFRESTYSNPEEIKKELEELIKKAKKLNEELELNEAQDSNDPVLVALRASIEDRKKSMALQKERMKKRVYGKQREKLEDQLWHINQDLKDAYIERRNIFDDMEAEAGQKGEDWSDDDANPYGVRLNLVDDEIKSLITRRQQIEIKLTY